MVRALYACILVLTAALSVPLASAADVKPATKCDRACLNAITDQYIDGLIHKDPSRVPFADHVMYTENNVVLEMGDGLWGTITGMSAPVVRLADPDTGQTAYFAAVHEHDTPSFFIVRLKIADRQITEVETLVSRKGFLGIGPYGDPNKWTPAPNFAKDVPVDKRRPRARMISIADGYFDTLQLNDGTLFTQFAKGCNRRENGLQMTNVKDAKTGKIRPDCGDQFKLGTFRFDDRLRARRFPLIDEEKGVVLASAFIDHAGTIGTYKLTDGTTTEAPTHFPHTYYLMEAFKIVDGAIAQIEAAFITVPYNMRSPWTHRRGH